MTWKFDVVATKQQRLFSRILQTLECQMLSIHAFAGEAREDGVCVTFVVSSEEDKAYRVKALLYRVEGVRSVSASTFFEGVRK
jgi:hypothetical protein